ncbi:MAG TPA: hypothetical protein VFY39_05740 [Gammaproteobacteria bacterium]|nr:hypothetical protein [Gammaproteobacteria bacterium]
MQALQSLPPIVALVLGLVLLAWVIFAFLVPFMVESIRQSTRKTHLELVELNKKLDLLNAALKEAQLRPAPAAGGRHASERATGAAAARTQAAELPVAGDPSARQGRQAKAAKAEGRRRPEPGGRREPTISPADFESGSETAPNRRGPNSK